MGLCLGIQGPSFNVRTSPTLLPFLLKLGQFGTLGGTSSQASVLMMPDRTLQIPVSCGAAAHGSGKFSISFSSNNLLRLPFLRRGEEDPGPISPTP